MNNILSVIHAKQISLFIYSICNFFLHVNNFSPSPQIDPQKLNELSTEQIGEIVFGPLCDDGLSGAVALLLGGNPKVLRERALAAAQLYHAGRVPFIMPTGGVKWDTELGYMSEAECLSLLLQEYGVPKEAIILENGATTTRENMTLCSYQMERQLKLRGHYRVYIITSPAHIRRSYLLAKQYLPRTVDISVYPRICPAGQKQNWFLDEYQTDRVMRELHLLKEFLDQGQDIEDIEF